jgi:hypothetical protein
MTKDTHPNPVMKNTISVSAPFLGALCAVVMLVFGSPPAGAASGNPPGKITYQGFLTDANGTPLANTVPENKTVIFRIWSGATGGTRIWSEQQSVAVDKGHFSVLLGEGSAVSGEVDTFAADLSLVFSGGGDRYLELRVDGTTLAPRLQFLPAPFSVLAFRARGLTDNRGSQKVFVDSDGLGIGVANPRYPLDVNGRVVATSFSGNGSGLTSLNANNISSGTLNSSRIPSLSASKITSGTLHSSRIPSLSASKITSGTFSSSARIPNLPASKITSGTLSSSRIPGLTTSKINSGRFSTSRLPSTTVYGDTSAGKTFRVGGSYNNVAEVFEGSDKSRSTMIYRTAKSGVFRLKGPSNHSSKDRYALYNGDSNWDFGSDRNLKKDIQDAEPLLDRVLKVKLRRFRWKEDAPTDGLKMGVIAQELEPLFPGMVSSNTHPDGESSLSVGYSDFGMISVKAIQELKQRTDGEIATLKQDNLTLKQQLADLLARMQALEAKSQ